MTEDYLQTRIQAPCDDIHKHLVYLNDSDNQLSYRPETFNVVTNTHQKAKETREYYWRDFWMCENVRGQQVAQFHDNYMMIHLLPLYHNAQSAAQCRISAFFDHTYCGSSLKGFSHDVRSYISSSEMTGWHDCLLSLTHSYVYNAPRVPIIKCNSL